MKVSRNYSKTGLVLSSKCEQSSQKLQNKKVDIHYFERRINVEQLNFETFYQLQFGDKTFLEGSSLV
jgi:hypothetical protein